MSRHSRFNSIEFETGRVCFMPQMSMQSTTFSSAGKSTITQQKPSSARKLFATPQDQSSAKSPIPTTEEPPTQKEMPIFLSFYPDKDPKRLSMLLEEKVILPMGPGLERLQILWYVDAIEDRETAQARRVVIEGTQMSLNVLRDAVRYAHLRLADDFSYLLDKERDILRFVNAELPPNSTMEWMRTGATKVHWSPAEGHSKDNAAHVGDERWIQTAPWLELYNEVTRVIGERRRLGLVRQDLDTVGERFGV